MSPNITEIQLPDDTASIELQAIRVLVTSEILPPPATISTHLREQLAKARLEELRRQNDAMLDGLRNIERAEVEARVRVRLLRPESLSE